MKLGYNTNGLAHHRCGDALELVAECGYRSVAITVDHHCLDPNSSRSRDEVASVRQQLDRLGLSSVIETGARYLLDARRKHEPTLMSPRADDRQRRVDFLKNCIDVAAELRSEAVSFWSGIQREEITENQSFERLVEGCREVVDYASDGNVRLAFEPEPGMFIETMEQYARLHDRIDAAHFGLTIDIGHLQCVEAEAISAHLHRWASHIFDIHIEDMCRGVHEHLRFGEGEIDFRPVLATLREIDYSGGVHVELSRHSHMVPQVMRESFNFLNSILSELA